MVTLNLLRIKTLIEDEFLNCDFSTILKSIFSNKDHFMFANGIKIQDLQLV